MNCKVSFRGSLFFNQYRPQFFACRIHFSADYEAFIGNPKSDGIEFVEQYLRCIEAENSFCVKFGSTNIHNLLCGLPYDYRNIPLNIFEYVMLAALGLIMVKQDPTDLALTSDDICRLYVVLSDKSDPEIEECLKHALEMLKELGLLPELTQWYMSNALKKFISIISKAVNTNTLESCFLLSVNPEHEEAIYFNYGERMADMEYLKLFERIMCAETGEEKTTLILNEVHSFADLIDILTDTYLSENDFDQLVNALPFEAFIFFASRIP